MALKAGVNTYTDVASSPLLLWDDFGLCETLVKEKDNGWELGGEFEETMGQVSWRNPVYNTESEGKANWGSLRNPIQPPVKPSICYRHVGDNVTAFEVYREVQFMQKNKYQQVCSTCYSCNVTGGGTCGPWEKVGPFDAKEVPSFPLIRTRSWFEESNYSPCIKMPFRLPRMGR